MNKTQQKFIKDMQAIGNAVRQARNHLVVEFQKLGDAAKKAIDNIQTRHNDDKK